MVLGVFGNSGKVTRRAAEQNRELIQSFNRQATGHRDKGLTAGSGYLSEARDLYRPLTELGERGVTVRAGRASDAASA